MYRAPPAVVTIPSSASSSAVDMTTPTARRASTLPSKVSPCPHLHYNRTRLTIRRSLQHQYRITRRCPPSTTSRLRTRSQSSASSDPSPSSWATASRRPWRARTASTSWGGQTTAVGGQMIHPDWSAYRYATTEYVISMPNMYARGILWGKMVLELGDSCTAKNDRTAFYADIQFKTKVAVSVPPHPCAVTEAPWRRGTSPGHIMGSRGGYAGGAQIAASCAGSGVP